MKIEGRGKLDIEVVLVLNEEEARALDAITSYGVGSFLEMFYRYLGKSYLQNHEAGCISLFESVRNSLPGVLGRVEQARAVFDGVKYAATIQLNVKE